METCRKSKCVVFSTCVEVILKSSQKEVNKLSILHVCGGDPDKWYSLITEVKYSPRVWR